MKLKQVLSTSLICFSVAVSAQTIPDGERLKDVKKAVGVGTVLQTNNQEAKDIVLGTNQPTRNVFLREFSLGQVTCYPFQTWPTSLAGDAIPAANDLDFNIKMSEVNQSINYLKMVDKKISMHVLVTKNSYYPHWFSDRRPQVYNAQQLRGIMTNFINTVMTSNTNFNKVDYWNVVNETLDMQGKYFNNTTLATKQSCMWYEMGQEPDLSGLTGAAKINAEHPRYIQIAFRIANNNLTSRSIEGKKLELRENNAEFWGLNKGPAFYQLTKHLLNSGTPIHAVGLQGHFQFNKTYDWTLLTKTIQEYNKLGLEVYITEMDYADNKEVDPKIDNDKFTEEDSFRQREQYRQAVEAMLKGGVKWICFWGIKDHTNPYWLMHQDPLLFNENLVTKRAYYGVQKGLSTPLPLVSSVSTNQSIIDLQAQPGSVPIISNNIMTVKLTAKPSQVLLYSFEGKKLVDLTSQEAEVTIDLNSYKTGMYILKVSSSEGTTTKKIFKN